MSPSASFTLAMDVRDYECDLQGIVNNAVYLNYLEHARHQVLRQLGLRFDALTAAGIHLVVVRSEVDYKRPLRSGDRFTVSSGLARLTPVRFAFLQEIHRDGEPPELMLTAHIVCTAMNDAGRPILPPPALAPLMEACGPEAE